MEQIAAIILGVIIGSVIGWMLSRGKQQALVAKNEMLQAQLETQKQESQQMLRDAKEEWSSQLEMAKQEAEKRNQTLLVEKEKTYREALEAKDAACREMLAGQEKRHAEAMEAQQARFEEIMAKVSAQVKSATDDMLKQRQKEFAESSHENLGQIVNPLRETIDKMKQAMTENTLKQTSMSSEMMSPFVLTLVWKPYLTSAPSFTLSMSVDLRA